MCSAGNLSPRGLAPWPQRQREDSRKGENQAKVFEYRACILLQELRSFGSISAENRSYHRVFISPYAEILMQESMEPDQQQERKSHSKHAEFSSPGSGAASRSPGGNGQRCEHA